MLAFHYGLEVTVARAGMKATVGLIVVRNVTPSSADGFPDLVYQITILNLTQLVETLRYKPESRGFNSR